MNMNYSEVVQQCFRRGEPDWKDWDDYLALGFTPAHVPELTHILENTAQIWIKLARKIPPNGRPSMPGGGWLNWALLRPFQPCFDCMKRKEKTIDRKNTHLNSSH